MGGSRRGRDRTTAVGEVRRLADFGTVYANLKLNLINDHVERSRR